MDATFRYSNEREQWVEGTVSVCDSACANVVPDGRVWQRMYGFGGCFNELGGDALACLPPERRKEVLSVLFDPDVDGGCRLNFCRLPIGANDYARNWYSLDETPGDYDLLHFSIERDQEILIPYVRAALEHAPDLTFFSSPWSPPTWMKEPSVYNWGTLLWTERNLKSYADYFVRYVKAYREEGIPIRQVHVQNEPVANQKFPSCMWTGEMLRDFIKLYLGPAFRSAGLDTELWLGTINAPGCDYRKLLFDKWATEDYDYFANTVLSDDKARSYLSGVSYQWGGKIAIQRTFESWWPDIRLMQSENECGFGDNTWEYALYMWTMMRHYIDNGAESYLYWNLILQPGGVSTWGDPQNAMVTIDSDGKTVHFNPDFHVMRHFSSLIRRGAVRLGIGGRWAADSLLFRNPDGSCVLETFNPFAVEKCVRPTMDGRTYEIVLPPRSVGSLFVRE